MTKQIKSKQRVADHGEVFTREQEVNAMLDLIEQRPLQDEATYLEPACGDGNFLIAIFVHLYHGRKYLYQLANFVLSDNS